MVPNHQPVDLLVQFMGILYGTPVMKKSEKWKLFLSVEAQVHRAGRTKVMGYVSAKVGPTEVI